MIYAQQSRLEMNKLSDTLKSYLISTFLAVQLSATRLLTVNTETYRIIDDAKKLKDVGMMKLMQDCGFLKQTLTSLSYTFVIIMENFNSHRYTCVILVV